MIILVHACTHRSWAHRQRVSTIFLTWIFFSPCAPDRIWTSALWSSSLTFYQLSHPITTVKTITRHVLMPQTVKSTTCHLPLPQTVWVKTSSQMTMRHLPSRHLLHNVSSSDLPSPCAPYHHHCLVFLSRTTSSTLSTIVKTSVTQCVIYPVTTNSHHFFQTIRQLRSLQ